MDASLQLPIRRMMVAIAWLGVSFACAAAVYRNMQNAGEFGVPVVFALSVMAAITFFAGAGTLFARAMDGALVGLWVWLYGFGMLLLWELGRQIR